MFKRHSKYTELDKSIVHNINIFSITKEKEFVILIVYK